MICAENLCTCELHGQFEKWLKLPFQELALKPSLNHYYSNNCWMFSCPHVILGGRRIAGSEIYQSLPFNSRCQNSTSSLPHHWGKRVLDNQVTAIYIDMIFCLSRTGRKHINKVKYSSRTDSNCLWENAIRCLCFWTDYKSLLSQMLKNAGFTTSDFRPQNGLNQGPTTSTILYTECHSMTQESNLPL